MGRDSVEFPTERVVPKDIYIIGAGGVTSYFLPPFVKTLAHKFPENPPRVHLIDGDVLEDRNLLRQLFHTSAVSKNKAEALKDHYRGEYKNLTAVKKYFALGSRLKDNSLVFVFVDNHPARRAALEACDRHNCVAILAANEYTDAQSIYYHPRYKGGPLDPRVRYPEIMTDQSDDPMRPVGCATGAALEAAPQLPIANHSCANYALQKFWFYYFVAPGMDQASRKYFPVEHSNNFNKLCTKTEESYGIAA